MKRKHSKQWLTAVILAALLLGGLSLFLWKTDILSRIGDLEGLKEYIRSLAPWSHLVFFLLQLSSVIVAPIPSNMMAMAGGACFGLLEGFAITACAVTLGSLFTFSVARLLGQKWASQLLGRKLSPKYLELIQRKRDSFLVLVFLFPFFPDDIICILAGLTDIPFHRFAMIVLLTRPWGLLAASALGNSIVVIPTWALPLIGIVGLVLFALGLRYGDAVEAKLLKRFGKS